MQRESISDKFPIGSKLPSFELINVDDSVVANDYFNGAKAILVAFTCNHCPYVKGSEEMLIKIVRKFSADGLKCVTISSNDATQYPEDDFPKMKEKAKQMVLPYPYLYDQTQEIARKFDAACTPEIYLFNAKQELVYHGAINDSHRDPSKVTKDYLSEAITAVLEGYSPNPAFVHSIGCSIKWK